MAWYSFLPKLTVPKKIIFENGKLNALWYFLHLPILAYATVLFVVQLQYTEVITNTPFLMIHVDPLDALPYETTAYTEDPSIQSWCAAAGGPFPCDSNPMINAACVELLTQEILSQIPGLAMLMVCSRLCDLDKIGAFDCMVPPSLFRQQGSTSLQIIPYTAFNQGLFTGGNKNVVVQLHPLLRHSPVTFTYSFQMSRAAPFFFGTDADVANRKSGADAYTVALTVDKKALLVFAPGERILVQPPYLVELAGLSWNVTMLMQGGEFYAVVNCYTHRFDLPSNLDWAGHSEIEPTIRVPVCLLTVDQLRPFSGYKRTNVILDLAEAASQIRVDTGRGSSFHRLPSLAAVVLNLISLVVLLKFPILTILFATTCLGSLSNVYKRAQQETLDVSTRIAQLGLRLLSDTMALMLVDPDEAGVSKPKLKEKLQGVLQKVAPSQQEHEVIAEDLSEHIFKTLRKMPQFKDKLEDGDPAQGSQLATLMSSGQTVNVNDLCAYFDTNRRRSCLEWFLLPYSQRKFLRQKRKEAKENLQKQASGEAVNAKEDELKDSVSVPEVPDVPDVEVSAADQILEVEALQSEIDVLMGQVRALKDSRIEEDREEERQQEVENRMQHLHVAIEKLMGKMDAFEAENTTAASTDRLTTLTQETEALEARVMKFEEENVRLDKEIKALHKWADDRQAAALQELESETKTTVAITSTNGVPTPKAAPVWSKASRT